MNSDGGSPRAGGGDGRKLFWRNGGKLDFDPFEEDEAVEKFEKTRGAAACPRQEPAEAAWTGGNGAGAEPGPEAKPYWANWDDDETQLAGCCGSAKAMADMDDEDSPEWGFPQLRSRGARRPDSKWFLYGTAEEWAAGISKEEKDAVSIFEGMVAEAWRRKAAEEKETTPKKKREPVYVPDSELAAVRGIFAGRTGLEESLEYVREYILGEYLKQGLPEPEAERASWAAAAGALEDVYNNYTEDDVLPYSSHPGYSALQRRLEKINERACSSRPVRRADFHAMLAAYFTTDSYLPASGEYTISLAHLCGLLAAAFAAARDLGLKVVRTGPFSSFYTIAQAVLDAEGPGGKDGEDGGYGWLAEAAKRTVRYTAAFRGEPEEDCARRELKVAVDEEGVSLSPDIFKELDAFLGGSAMDASCDPSPRG